MKTTEIRHLFLDFFKHKDHAIYPSDSLVPSNDPTLLFTSAGMNQFKDMFLGKGRLPHKRIATCQKCFRTGDIEKVGRTTYHHTFFEMLGNFSFGDYFKKEAIQWAWEFFTRILKIPPENLFASVFVDDIEAYNIWHDVIGLPDSKIFKFGEDENFWPANARTQGPNGPCGPCSEIYYDFGPQYGCGKPDCQVGCPCGRYVEVWNLVFTQFDRQEGGILAPLSQKNIDTGMGLERLAAVMQGVFSNFHIDIFKPIINAISEELKINYNYHSIEGAKIRRIADHIRAIVFLICDGVLPSNVARGYVERKVLRHAQRESITLGKNQPFLYKIVDAVVEVMGDWYKELYEKKDIISKIIKAEEERFIHTVEKGNAILEEMILRIKKSGTDTLSGEDAFLLYDTYGFPIDLTCMILQENGFKVDTEGFEKLLHQQRLQARASAKFSSSVFVEGPLEELKVKFAPPCFVGYEQTQSDSKILAIIKGEHLVETASCPDEVAILLDTTAFYGEKGGQVGDTGKIISQDAEVEIFDTQCPENYILHFGKITKGSIKVMQNVKAIVDKERRFKIMQNHTATHIMQSALRELLGPHVRQAGSLVAPDRLRFDFTHFESLSEQEIHKIEEYVNEKILSCSKVDVREVLFEEAKRLGAITVLGEKYAEVVRLVSIGDFSKELCGGTHLSNTGSIGFFKIVSESSISAGVRRIEAVTGESARNYVYHFIDIVDEIARFLQTPREQIVDKIKNLVEENKKLKQEIAKARKVLSLQASDEMLARAKKINGNRVVIEKLEGVSVEDMRSLCDRLVKSGQAVACLLASETDGKFVFVVFLGQELIKKGGHAGQIAKKLGQICGGGGGGAEHIAQAGVKDPSKLPEAFAYFEKAIADIVKSG